MSALLLEIVFWKISGPHPPLWMLQHAFWTLGGLTLIWAVVLQAARRKDNVGLLLLAWLALAVIFPAFVNWGVSARSLVPLIPVAGLLAARVCPGVAAWPRLKVFACALPMLACSLLVAAADFEMALVNKNMASTVAGPSNRSDVGARTIWFEGHWGDQYYMQKWGAKPLDVRGSDVAANDILILPMNNADLTLPPPGRLALYKKISVPYRLPVSDMNKRTAAGYHSYYWGGLPFVFGPTPQEDFYLLIFPSAQRGLGA
jgi:hypothetical protein